MTASSVRKAMRELTVEQVLDLCWTQHETNFPNSQMTRQQMGQLDKDTLIDCFIKTARQNRLIK